MNAWSVAGELFDLQSLNVIRVLAKPLSPRQICTPRLVCARPRGTLETANPKPTGSKPIDTTSQGENGTEGDHQAAPETSSQRSRTYVCPLRFSCLLQQTANTGTTRVFVVTGAGWMNTSRPRQAGRAAPKCYDL